MTEYTTFDYVDDADERQRLDVFPADPATDTRTAVLVLHGGGFRFGERGAVHARCRALAERGFTAVAVGYRLMDAAPWPAPIDDAGAALRWAREHAGQLGVDAERIAVQGHSAGGHMALLLGGTASPAPAAVIAFFAPTAVSVTPGPGTLPAQMLLGPDATPEAATAASPIAHVREGFPPTALVHGAADRFMPAVSSLRFFDELTAAGTASELHVIAGQDHEFDMTPRYLDSSADFVASFLRAQVVEPEKAAKEVVDANPFASMPPPGAGPAPDGS